MKFRGSPGRVAKEKSKIMKIVLNFNKLLFSLTYDFDKILTRLLDTFCEITKDKGLKFLLFTINRISNAFTVMIQKVTVGQLLILEESFCPTITQLF